MSCTKSFGDPPYDDLWMFVDESGDLIFTPASSPVYIFTAVWTYAPTCIASDLPPGVFSTSGNPAFGQCYHG